MRIAILGVGLIGGSIGLAARERCDDPEIVGFGRSKERLGLARELGAIDKVAGSLEEALDGAVACFCCAPVGALSGARAITVPLDEHGRHDLEAMAREVTVATRLVLVCNPNNPTATALPVDDIDAFLSDLPHNVAVIVDEAYVEFNMLQDPDDSLDLLRRHPNLVLLRTFSKVYGLCGLRVGYALGSEAFRLAIDRVRQPFSVNALAQAAAAEAVRHQDEVERRVENTVVERVHVESELAARGLQTTESQANFSWVSLGDRDEAEVVRGLAERCVIVRAGKALGEEGRMRVTFGTRVQNDRFLAALDEVL